MKEEENTVKFKYELGEMVADCMNTQGLVIERFHRVVTRPHEDGRPGNRAVRVRAYKVAFPATEDGESSHVPMCEEDDLFPADLQEAFERQMRWDEAFDGALEAGGTHFEATAVAEAACAGLRLVT